MTSACEATTRALPGAAVIELSGEVDGSAAAILTEAYERAVTAGPENHDTVVLDLSTTCVDSRRQWRHARNVWHNSMVRSVVQTATPSRRVKSPDAAEPGDTKSQASG